MRRGHKASRVRPALSLLLATALLGVLTVVGSQTQASIASGANGLVAVSNAGTVFAVDPVTGTRSPLLASSVDIRPSVSPNGKRVAVAAGGNIFVSDFPSGNNRQQVTTTGTFQRPSWDPASTTLVFDGDTVVTAPATFAAPVTAVNGTNADDTFADYSPDGQFIVFSTPATPGIGRVNAANTGGRMGLVGTTTGDTHPRVSPNGSSVVFECASAPGPGICTVPFPNGGSRSLLAGTGAGDQVPTYAPDGTKVAFRRNDAAFASLGIGTVNANGTGGFGFLVGTTAGDSDPSWSIATGGAAPPAVAHTINFSAASACGSPAMFNLLSPTPVTVAATDTLGHAVTLSAIGADAGSLVAFNAATGGLTLNLNAGLLLPAVLNVIGSGVGTLAGLAAAIPGIGPLLTPLFNALIGLLAPQSVTITATDTATPAAVPATCTKQIRLNLF